MPNHNFEPGQLVLVRDADEKKWLLKHFSHVGCGEYPFYTTDGSCSWRQCLPFNDETKALLNRTNAYDPPKPPQEYEWGQKVEVNQGDSRWKAAIYIAPTRDNDEHWCTKKESPYTLSVLKGANIRPMPDSAAHADD